MNLYEAAVRYLDDAFETRSASWRDRITIPIARHVVQGAPPISVPEQGETSVVSVQRTK